MVLSSAIAGRIAPVSIQRKKSAEASQDKQPVDQCSISCSPPREGEVKEGYPKAPPADRSWLWAAHDFAASQIPGVFGAAVGFALQGISEVTEQGTGLNVKQLVDAERTLYQTLVPSRLGHVGGSPPIFQALAEGQAAYVHLGKEDAYHADHLTRLYSGLSSDKLLELGVGNDRMTPVHQVLQDRIRNGNFPAYVNVNGNLGQVTPTESIVMESISSIANKENELSTPMRDPTEYYKWLVTRVESAYRQVDPWMYAVSPVIHERVADVKDNLTPAWIKDPSSDPLGWLPSQKDVQKSYDIMMELAGDSQLSNAQGLTDFADAVVTLDRDLLFGTQTYWTKFLRELSPEQRETALTPLAQGWVGLNTVPPDDPLFEHVSPDNAPYITLYDRRSKKVIHERYDRSMSLSEAVDHTLDGLGVEAREKFADTLLGEIRNKAGVVQAREMRVRELLGADYSGLDVAAILDGRMDIDDFAVRRGLAQLREALQGQGEEQREMTTRRAEIIRHVDLLDWVATREKEYGNPALKLLSKMTDVGDEPVIVSEFWRPDGARPTPLPPLQRTPEILGKPDQQAPLPVSVVMQGGGGKGFAYAEALQQLKNGLAQADGQVNIDRYVGSSAGALSAGLLAAGYSADELAGVLEELDFKKFYADYLWLGGGVDPEVRGIDRTGMFTVRQMYRNISELISRKVQVSGRPVLFRDLPKDLKVTATLANSDLPPELKDKFEVDQDGLVVFSSETTPNMDVAAAMCASSSVPLFFAAPQLLVARNENGEARDYRMQMMDGGVVYNFPVNEAVDAEEKAVMVSPPVYYKNEGRNAVSLSTLNFDKADLAVINDYNRQRYQEFAPQIGRLLQKAQDSGAERGVLALRLTTPEAQKSPLVQGRDRNATKQIRQLAEQVNLKTLSEKDARKHMRGAFNKERGYGAQVALDKLLDKDYNYMQPSFWGEPGYKPGDKEANDLSDVLVATIAAQTAAGYKVDERLFERG